MMNRRKFFGIALGAAAATVVPSAAQPVKVDPKKLLTHKRCCGQSVLIPELLEQLSPNMAAYFGYAAHVLES